MQRAEVTRLQRALLGLLRDSRRVYSPEVRNLRRSILQLDPNACIYRDWGGDMPAEWAPINPERPSTAYARIARKDRK